MIFYIYKGRGEGKMLRIAICDDDENDLEIINDYIINLLHSLSMEFNIHKFKNGFKLLETAISFDLLLLDIEMDEINGIDVARNIREFNRDIKIVFISNSQSYLRVGYSVKADGYIIKPINKIEFNYELTNILKENIIDNKFILDKRIGPYKIFLNDIIYIEFYNRKTFIHMTENKIATNLTLKEWNTLLEDYQFAQCHKAYIINLRYIDTIKVDSVILTSGDEITLGRKFKPEFRCKYLSSIGAKI